MIRFPVLSSLALLVLGAVAAADETKDEAPAPISFHKQIRPILQAHCQGCHQPAKAGGGYVMTDFSRLLAGGESELAAVVPAKPEESYLVELITPVDGEAQMPKEKPPLDAGEIDLIRQWIAAGAHDDTPENATQRFDMDHPPVYYGPPVVTSLDFSPDGTLLAVAGFHEVLLVNTESGELAARLVGVAERIESVAFSPDGTRLAVTGGVPSRMGEIQVWDVAGRKLQLSVPMTYETVYGASWSPDGKRIAFGCTDNAVRAIDSETGEQVLFQGAHNDWVRDTVFSKDGSHLVSVGRDMTCKLTEVETERFVDNITSITPGVLKGGVNAVARHPERDEIAVGGADGVVKVYRLFRLTARRIGDDANLIRQMPPMRGRVFGVDVSRDGKRIAAVSSLDGQGQLHVYSYEFDTGLPDDIKKIQGKTVQQRTADEKKKIAEYRSRDVKLIASAEVPESSLYAVAFSPDNARVAVAGSDGSIRLVDAATAEITAQFSPAPISEPDQIARASERVAPFSIEDEPGEAERLPAGTKLTGLTVEPATIELARPHDYVQLLVRGQLDTGDIVDVTRMATFTVSAPVIEVSASGLVTPRSDGQATLRVETEGQAVELAVNITGTASTFTADFIQDVNPVLSRLGCNAGTCHGADKGKNGFKLSLRGYDPVFDVRALTDDLASRRTNVASADDSLMLYKATGASPHVGGQLLRQGEPYYEIIRSWIASGCKLESDVPRVASIRVSPQNPVVQDLQSKQQIRVIATYEDGRQRDVTREAFIESGNTEIAEVNRTGRMVALRRGEAPVLARFEGAYAATTLTVMGNRDGFVWREPEKWNKIDELVAAKWKRMKIQPSGLCSDAEFLRRVYLDLTGLPPTADEVRAFLADDRETRVKRDDVINRLIGNDAFVEHWSNKWADLLQVNRKFLGPEGAAAFRQWIRGEIRANTPYDEFVRKILTASGSNKDNPPASYYKILRNPEDIMENTTHLFLAVRFNCNKCHDHPFERWTQDQYYETAAYFARVDLKADPASGKRRIGGTAVEGAKPFYEVVYDGEQGEVTHVRTGQEIAPEFPYETAYQSSDDATRREQLAAWVTSPDNQYFARSYVNRLWGYMLGVGIMEPIDDIRASNPPTNPELLDYLTSEFLAHDFDVRHVLRLICSSRTYQLSLATNPFNEDDQLNYSHAVARRLQAEVLYDAIHFVTGSESKIPGVPPGTRAAALPDSGIRLPDGFLNNLGRPPRESACECERVNELQLGPVMALVSGPTVGNAIADPENALAQLAAREPNDVRMVNEIFLRVLNRPADIEEIAAVLDSMNQVEKDHQQLAAALAEREAWWKKRKPELEKERVQSIAQAEADLKAYEQKIAPHVAMKEKEQAEKVAQAEAQVKAYRDQLPQHLAAWEKKQDRSVEWRLLEPGELTASNGIQLHRLDDRSIRATGDADKATYTVVVRTSLAGITGIRLEALPDESIPGGGPGIPKNGNFVVSEFQVQAAAAQQPKNLQTVKLQNAKADFSQENFSPAQAIDGNPNDQRGWAVSPAVGVVHWATFETAQPLGHDGGTVLKFVIHQKHNAKKHLLGRFRISVTTASSVGVSLPEPLQAAIATPAAWRTEAQKQRLTAYFEKTDAELAKRAAAVAEAKRPLPEDPGVTARKKALALTKEPVRDDRLLVQLRKDVEFSAKQTENKRLTVAQDLAWALINNPAFLFNR